MSAFNSTWAQDTVRANRANHGGQGKRDRTPSPTPPALRINVSVDTLEDEAIQVREVRHICHEREDIRGMAAIDR